jgi:serine phosphatase RsbU (regulator of sigma subunit)
LASGAIEGEPGAEYGVERLIDLARRLRGRPAKEIGEAILADVEAYCGDSAPQDDRTVLVVSSPAP